MEPPKISFSFTKSFKKPNIVAISNTATPKETEKKGEIIECLEEQSIKIKDAVVKDVHPLVIPLKDDQKSLVDRIKAAKKWDKKKETEDTRADSELTADELAARQLMREAKARLENGHKSNNNKVSVLPLTEETTSLTGEKEPTLEDYESVPIGDYGLALLRGMGWKDGMAIGKNVTKSAALSIPELRPKGLGLGATKVELSEKKATDEDGNELILLKGGFAKAVMGPQNGNYCEIQGFDDEAGRVIIKVYPKGDIININELMLVPVTKEEFSKGSKILNNAKYEQYKKLSDKKLENFKVKKEKSDSEDSDGFSKAATSSKYSKRSTSLESERETSKYSHKRRQSRSRSKDKERKESRSYRDRDQNKKDTKKSSGSNHWLESDRTASRSRSTDRKSRKKYRSKSRSWSNGKKKDEEESTSRSRSDKDRQKSRSKSEDSYQERKKSRSRSNKDERKSSNDKLDKDKRESRSRSKKSRNKSKDKTSYHSLKHKSSQNRSGSLEKTYSKGKKKKKSSHKSKKDRHFSEDSDRSRSTSKDKHSKNKKSREPSYSSDSDIKKEKRRKNKCKSRHRQASSSDSEDKKYRKKK